MKRRRGHPLGQAPHRVDRREAQTNRPTTPRLGRSAPIAWVPVLRPPLVRHIDIDGLVGESAPGDERPFFAERAPLHRLRDPPAHEEGVESGRNSPVFERDGLEVPQAKYRIT